MSRSIDGCTYLFRKNNIGKKTIRAFFMCVCTTVLYEYINSLRNDVCNLFVNTHVRIIIHEEEFEDTKGVIRIRISKIRQHNGQKYKRTNNDLQNTYTTKD